jgi:hypothetical protein
MEHFAQVRSSGSTSVISRWASLRHHTHWNTLLHTSTLTLSDPTRRWLRSRSSSMNQQQASHSRYLQRQTQRQPNVIAASGIRTAWAQGSALDLSSIYFPCLLVTYKTSNHSTKSLVVEPQDSTPLSFGHFSFSQPVSSRIYLNIIIPAPWFHMTVFQKVSPPNICICTSSSSYMSSLSQSPIIYYFNNITRLYKSRYILFCVLTCQLTSVLLAFLDLTFMIVLLHPFLGQINPRYILTTYVLKEEFYRLEYNAV